MLSLSESYTAIENLFDIPLYGNEGLPFLGDLVNESALGLGEQRMYYGNLRIVGKALDPEAEVQPTTGLCKLYLGTPETGELVYEKVIPIGESISIGEVLFTSFELVDCRGYFGGYKYVIIN